MTAMTGASGELRACPCGAVPNHGYYGDIADECGYGYVECHENGLSIVVHAETEADAISAWNASRPSIRDEALKLHYEQLKGWNLADFINRVRSVNKHGSLAGDITEAEFSAYGEDLIDKLFAPALKSGG